jgi:hypothetical protein
MGRGCFLTVAQLISHKRRKPILVKSRFVPLGVELLLVQLATGTLKPKTGLTELTGLKARERRRLESQRRCF